MKSYINYKKRQDYYRVLLFLLLFFDCFCLGYVYYSSAKETIPDTICITSGERATFTYDVPASGTIRSVRLAGQENEALKSNSWSERMNINLRHPFTLDAGQSAGEYELTSKLFGVLNLKQTKIKVMDEDEVIPCGMPVGIYIKTEGLLVLDTQILNCADGLNYEPAKNVVKTGDYILSANGKGVETKEELQDIIRKSGGEKISLGLRRNGKDITVSITPILTKEGDYKAGIWLRDDTQGLGTLTYIKGREFGALGHGINDYDTGTQMEIEGGSLYEARILSVKKGESGNPGELVGQVQYGKEEYIGEIESNSEEGIYGILECDISRLTDFDSMPIAYKQDVKKGKAQIRFVMDGESKDYEIKIVKVDGADRNKKQGIMFEVVDEELLSKTGGVVQGMSGSPIVQNGKLVGAVTHVLVNDPTRGYGIFSENMLEAAE